MKQNIGILVMLLSLIAFVSCEKAAVEPQGELIEVNFAAKPFTAAVESGLKSTATLPGWPEIPHLTEVDNALAIGQAVNPLFELVDISNLVGGEIVPGGINTLTVELPVGLWMISPSMFVANMDSVFWLGTNLSKYMHEHRAFSDLWNWGEDPPEAFTRITPGQSVLSMDLLPLYHCYVFRDPGNLIDSISTVNELWAEGAQIEELATIEDVRYVYSISSQLYVYLRDGMVIDVDVTSYIENLPNEELVYHYTPSEQIFSQSLPQSIYIDLTDVNASFEVAEILPYQDLQYTF